jgi:hypothetical protein
MPDGSAGGPTTQTIYALASERSAAHVRRFLDRFLPVRRGMDEDYPVPAYAAEPAHVYATDLEVLDYLAEHLTVPYELHWYDAMAGAGRRAMAVFTADGGLILGLEEDLIDASDRRRDLAAVAGTRHTLLGCEESPPDTTGAFIGRCEIAASRSRDGTPEPTLLEVVRAYADLQARLVTAMAGAHPVTCELRPQEWPQRGTIDLVDGGWRFRRHGLGFRFESLHDAAVVEAHERLATSPAAVDAFRLSTYLCSRFIRRVRHDGGLLDVAFDTLGAALAALAARGALTPLDVPSSPGCAYFLAAAASDGVTP